MNITITKIPLLELVSVHLSFIHIWSSENQLLLFLSVLFVLLISTSSDETRKFIQIFECIVEYEAL